LPSIRSDETVRPAPSEAPRHPATFWLQAADDGSPGPTLLLRFDVVCDDEPISILVRTPNAGGTAVLADAAETIERRFGLASASTTRATRITRIGLSLGEQVLPLQHLPCAARLAEVASKLAECLTR
jgi:hypothetical protein